MHLLKFLGFAAVVAARLPWLGRKSNTTLETARLPLLGRQLNGTLEAARLPLLARQSNKTLEAASATPYNTTSATTFTMSSVVPATTGATASSSSAPAYPTDRPEQPDIPIAPHDIDFNCVRTSGELTRLLPRCVWDCYRRALTTDMCEVDDHICHCKNQDRFLKITGACLGGNKGVSPCNGPDLMASVDIGRLYCEHWNATAEAALSQAYGKCHSR